VSLFSALLGMAALVLFFALIFLVIFGQITVRKLRKNPETKEELGIEFVSGWDIFNVASALALPRWLNRRFRNSPIAFLSANAEILDKHTNIVDRVLATIFFSLFYFSTIALIVLMIMDKIGVFDK